MYRALRSFGLDGSKNNECDVGLAYLTAAGNKRSSELEEVIHNKFLVQK
jgi:hypothetical protein